jgi:hypothetical protein
VATDPLFQSGTYTIIGGNGGYATPLAVQKNGNATITGTLTENSDERLKASVEGLGDTLAAVGSLRGVRYHLKETGRNPVGLQIGLLAQDVQAAFPELVHADSEGTLSVAYGRLAAILIEAVKSQGAAIDRERAALEERRKRISDLRAALAEACAEAQGLRDLLDAHSGAGGTARPGGK